MILHVCKVTFREADKNAAKRSIFWLNLQLHSHNLKHEWKCVMNDIKKLAYLISIPVSLTYKLHKLWLVKMLQNVIIILNDFKRINIWLLHWSVIQKIFKLVTMLYFIYFWILWVIRSKIKYFCMKALRPTTTLIKFSWKRERVQTVIHI